ILGLILFCAISVGAVPTSAQKSYWVTKCGKFDCDMQDHYCEPRVGQCEKCIEACSESIIAERESYKIQCYRICPVFMRDQEYKRRTPTSSSSTTTISSTNTPISSTNTPISSTNTPISSTNTPISSTNTPISSTNTPISSTNTPIFSTNTPISSTNTPITTSAALSRSSKNSSLIIVAVVAAACGMITTIAVVVTIQNRSHIMDKIKCLMSRGTNGKDDNLQTEGQGDISYDEESAAVEQDPLMTQNGNVVRVHVPTIDTSTIWDSHLDIFKETTL
ncbi:unnamed protein product, partial [Owenia fusiformis]